MYVKHNKCIYYYFIFLFIFLSSCLYSAVSLTSVIILLWRHSTSCLNWDFFFLFSFSFLFVWCTRLNQHCWLTELLSETALWGREQEEKTQTRTCSTNSLAWRRLRSARTDDSGPRWRHKIVLFSPRCLPWPLPRPRPGLHRNSP